MLQLGMVCTRDTEAATKNAPKNGIDFYIKRLCCKRAFITTSVIKLDFEPPDFVSFVKDDSCHVFDSMS